MPLTSLWQGRHEIAALAPDAPPTRAVGGGYDVVIVGAGITGLTTAVLMAEAGLSVLALEARLVGHGTTGRSTAKISLLQGTQFSQVARHHSDAVVADYAAANLEAQAWLADFCEGEDVDLDRRPAYTYCTTASGEDAARRELDAARTAGLPVTWVDDVPLPFATRGALRMDAQLQVDPVALLLRLRARAEALGAIVIENARVTGVHGSGPATVTTEHGEARASTVVVATNTPILDRGGYFARVEAARSYSLAFRTDGPRSTACTSRPTNRAGRCETRSMATGDRCCWSAATVTRPGGRRPRALGLTRSASGLDRSSASSTRSLRGRHRTTCPTTRFHMRVHSCRGGRTCSSPAASRSGG